MQSALVTGAAQGLGLATAESLARSGYEVTLVDLKPLDAAVQRLGQQQGARVHAICGDVASEAFAVALAEQIGSPPRRARRAGQQCRRQPDRPAEQTTAAQWQRVMDINLLGPFLLCRTLGAQMLARRAGSIINVASIAGLAGVSQRSAYNASKHGLVGLTRTLAAEWGGRGVRVNAVCPGWIKTEMDEADQRRGAYADADITDRVPMARFAQAQDVASAIVYLADPKLSGFVNGVCLPVDGGWTADASWDSLRVASRGP